MFEFYSELFISRSLRWCIGNWEWAKFVCYYFFRTRCFPGSYSEFSLYIFSAYNNPSLLFLIYIRTRVLLYRSVNDSKERKFFKDGNGFRLISLLCLRNYSNYQWQKIRRCNRKLKSDGSFRPLFDLDTCSWDFFSHILLFFSPLHNIHKILFNLHKIYNVHYRPERDQDDKLYTPVRRM